MAYWYINVFNAKNIPYTGLQFPHSNSKNFSNSSVLDAGDQGSIPDRDMFVSGTLVEDGDDLSQVSSYISILFGKNIFSQKFLHCWSISMGNEYKHKPKTSIMQYVGVL